MILQHAVQPEAQAMAEIAKLQKELLGHNKVR